MVARRLPLSRSWKTGPSMAGLGLLSPFFCKPGAACARLFLLPCKPSLPRFPGRRARATSRGEEWRLRCAKETRHDQHGIHYVTAIAGDVRRNVAFYTHDLGLRLVKKTVNFDDPGTTTPITATRPARRARS